MDCFKYEINGDAGKIKYHFQYSFPINNLCDETYIGDFYRNFDVKIKQK